MNAAKVTTNRTSIKRASTKRRQPPTPTDEAPAPEPRDCSPVFALPDAHREPPKEAKPRYRRLLDPTPNPAWTEHELGTLDPETVVHALTTAPTKPLAAALIAAVADDLEALVTLAASSVIVDANLLERLVHRCDMAAALVGRVRKRGSLDANDPEQP